MSFHTFTLPLARFPVQVGMLRLPFTQRLPRYSSISDFRIVAQLQPLLGARLGSRPPFGINSRHSVPAQRLDAEGDKYDTGRGLAGWLQCSVNLVHRVGSTRV